VKQIKRVKEAVKREFVDVKDSNCSDESEFIAH
jgi:hypothetical protein